MVWQRGILRHVSWSEMEREQSRLVDKVRLDPAYQHFLLCETLPTFTVGRSGSPEELLWSEAERARLGVACETVSRGGKWTFHGPGQILLYPIAYLPTLGYRKRDACAFLGSLRQGVLSFLSHLGLEAQPGDRPFGVYVRGRKLVSFGVCLRGGICSHGLALYLTPQSAYFTGIHPCGTPGQSFTSLEEEGIAINWESAASLLSEAVEKGFQKSKS